MIRSISNAEAYDRTYPEAAVRLEPTVVCVLLEDESARLLDMDGEFYALPPEGARMLCAALRYPPRKAMEKVAAHYGLTISQIASDFQEVIRALESGGLVFRSRDGNKKAAPKKSSKKIGQLIRFVFRSAHTLPGLTWALLSLARGSCLIYGWHGSATAWQMVKPQVPPKLSFISAPTALTRIDRVLQQCAASHILGASCKERALTAALLLRSMGMPSQLQVGIMLYPFTSHCWCQCDSEVIGDDPQRVLRFTTVYTYP